MFFGHIGVGLAVKPVAPKAMLWVLLVSGLLLDLFFAVFEIIGFEAEGAPPPWSHGLFMSLIWSIAALVIVFLYYRDLWTSAVIGLLVFSHWVLDFISWTTPLPLLFSSSPSIIGLGLSHSYVLEAIVEFSMLIGGIAIYIVTKIKSNRKSEEELALEDLMRENRKYMIISWSLAIGTMLGLILLGSISIGLATMFLVGIVIGIFCGFESSFQYVRAKGAL
ncbi:MAG: hypothetical protein ACFFC7_14695 [Candidatus Hermodarchaeota archaeon]